MSVRCLFYSPIEGSLYDKRHWRNFAIFEPFPAWSSEMGNPCLSLIWMVALFYNSSLTLNLIDGCRVTTISLRTWNAERTMPPAIAVPAGGSGSGISWIYIRPTVLSICNVKSHSWSSIGPRPVTIPCNLADYICRLLNGGGSAPGGLGSSSDGRSGRCQRR